MLTLTKEDIWEAVAELVTQQVAAESPRWEPMSHQIPPSPPWHVWLIEGGRGAGKTAGAAAYVDACARQEPIRISIIAPTLGDAVESCVNGPSGIKAHNPAVRLTQGMGGVHLRWPNGSEAKLFGAFTPEDVERLRAGGNRHLCIAAGTLVTTSSGPVPIEDVEVGARVLTRDGYRPVMASWSNGLQPTWRLETVDGQVVELTGAHRVWTSRGWVESRFLGPDDILLTCTKSSTQASTGIGIQTDTIATPVGDCCTDSCISASVGPSQTGCLSTIATTTRGITNRATSNSLRASNTQHIIRAIEPRWSMHGKQLGVSTMPLQHFPVPVRLAGLRSLQSEQAPSSVLGRVENEALTGRWSLPPVRNANNSSQSEQIGVGRLVPQRVVRCEPTGREALVWDLAVEGTHEFLAGGILVHNCWGEELAAWVRLDDVWDQMEFGLRLGEWPRIVASSTPKPRKRYLAIRTDEHTIRTGASTMVNPYLVQSVRDALVARYAGTRLGRQELDAEILTDVPGALWTYAMFEDRRPAPDLSRVVVAIDPSGGSDPEADEQGIGVAGKGTDGRGYVLADRSCRLSPDGWGRRAVQAYLDFKADRIVYERNFGGDMVEAVIQTAARAMGVTVVTRAVTASRGKRVRAEPIAALYEQGKVTHCESLPELEEQMCTWTPESGKSPDRLDWAVWALTDVMLSGNDSLEVY